MLLMTSVSVSPQTTFQLPPSITLPSQLPLSILLPQLLIPQRLLMLRLLSSLLMRLKLQGPRDLLSLELSAPLLMLDSQLAFFQLPLLLLPLPVKPSLPPSSLTPATQFSTEWIKCR